MAPVIMSSVVSDRPVCAAVEAVISFERHVWHLVLMIFLIINLTERYPFIALAAEIGGFATQICTQHLPSSFGHRTQTLLIARAPVSFRARRSDRPLSRRIGGFSSPEFECRSVRYQSYLFRSRSFSIPWLERPE